MFTVLPSTNRSTSIVHSSNHLYVVASFHMIWCTRLEISGIALQFAIQNARFAMHKKLMHSKIANHLKKNISADI